MGPKCQWCWYSHIFKAVVKALWIIGNFVSNELKGPASARIFAAKGTEADQLLTLGRGINIGLRIKFLQAANQMGVITAYYSSFHSLQAKLWVCF